MLAQQTTPVAPVGPPRAVFCGESLPHAGRVGVPCTVCSFTWQLTSRRIHQVPIQSNLRGVKPCPVLERKKGLQTKLLLFCRKGSPITPSAPPQKATEKPCTVGAQYPMEELTSICYTYFGPTSAFSALIFFLGLHISFK